MRSHYTWWSIPCVSARFYPPTPPPLPKLKPLKIIGMWKSHFYQLQSHLPPCWLSCTYTHTHTREDANKHYKASLFLFDRTPQWTSPPNLTPAFLIKKKKKKKTAKKRYITNHYWLLFIHLLFRACLIIITESANCCFLFDLPGTTEVLSGPDCSPPIFLPFR